MHKKAGGEHTKTLRGSTLQEVVDGGTDNNTLAAGVDGEATNFHAMAAGNVLDQRSLANDLNQFLAGVAVLINVSNVTRGHLLGQGDADGVLYNL